MLTLSMEVNQVQKSCVLVKMSCALVSKNLKSQIFFFCLANTTQKLQGHRFILQVHKTMLFCAHFCTSPTEILGAKVISVVERITSGLWAGSVGIDPFRPSDWFHQSRVLPWLLLLTQTRFDWRQLIEMHWDVVEVILLIKFIS